MCKNLKNKIIDQIDWKKCNELVPVIIQNVKTLEVLMLGFMNREAIILTHETGNIHFFSRTKNRIWMKGEDSGNVLKMVEMNLDCDGDTILAVVKPVGNTCHTGATSCFGIEPNFLNALEKTISQRIELPNEESYVSKLTSKGMNKIAQKVGEEGVEVTIAAISESDDLLLEEVADLLFHTIIALRFRKLSIFDAIEILKKRDKK
jgi:phosphoribosyl-ATP pyrophosphohydrolase/phosphoribosyl-AMP cyclohydrolase